MLCVEIRLGRSEAMTEETNNNRGAGGTVRKRYQQPELVVLGEISTTVQTGVNSGTNDGDGINTGS
jgi:hypothetical protein